jgi:hypothetical protein
MSISTDGRRGSPEACDFGGRGNRPHVLERVCTRAAASGRSGQLFPVSSWPPVRLQCLDGSHHQSVHRPDGAVCQTRESTPRAKPLVLTVCRNNRYPPRAKPLVLTVCRNNRYPPRAKPLVLTVCRNNWYPPDTVRERPAQKRRGRLSEEVHWRGRRVVHR